MGGTNATTRVAVEVLVEEEIVAEVRVGLRAFIEAMDRPAPFSIREKESCQTGGNLVGHLVQGEQVP